MAASVHASKPTVDQFAEALARISDWYTFGVFLGVPTHALTNMKQRSFESTMRCLIELYQYLEKAENEPPSWGHIISALKRMKENDIAEEIAPFLPQPIPTASKPRPQRGPWPETNNERQTQGVPLQFAHGEYASLSRCYTELLSSTQNALKGTNVDVHQLQQVVQARKPQKGLAAQEPLRTAATVDDFFMSLKNSVLDCQTSLYLAEELLKSDESASNALLNKVASFTKTVNGFKTTTKLGQLVGLTTSQAHAEELSFMLKVRHSWNQLTMRQFEKVICEILDTNFYDPAKIPEVSKDTDCICVKWSLSSSRSLVIPQAKKKTLSQEVINIIGVISLQIAEEFIYSDGTGSESIEAAMVQAVELKNKKAIELLMAMGCNPEETIYNGDGHAVTTVVNIKNADTSASPTSPHHVCIMGYDEDLELFLDSRTKDSSRSSSKKAKKEKESGIKVVFPRRKIGVGAKMKVKVITTDHKTTIKAKLDLNNEDCRVDNDGVGTHRVFVVPKQAGKGKLSIMTGQTGEDKKNVKGSPFEITVVPEQIDYKKMKNHTKRFGTADYNPLFTTFSKDGRMFVSCGGKDDAGRAVRVYDPEQTLQPPQTICTDILQFNPYGIDIDGDTIYICERKGHRIHTVSVTSGKNLGSFGEEGTGASKFQFPYDVKISPDDKIYVADSKNDRVQVFKRTWELDYIIDGQDHDLTRPEGIAFDLSGNVHITWWGSSTVTVHSPNDGKLKREYNKARVISGPVGIAIDPFGFSLVVSYNRGQVMVFNADGILHHTIGPFDNPYGVAIAPDGSVWVADRKGKQILKY